MSQPKWKTTSTKMEDDQNGRRQNWKTTKMEDDQNGRRPKWKTTKMEDDQNGRRPKWKMTKMEDNQNGRMGVRGGGPRRFIQPASSAIPRFRDFLYMSPLVCRSRVSPTQPHGT